MTGAVLSLKKPYTYITSWTFSEYSMKDSTHLQATGVKSNFCNFFLKHNLLSIQKYEAIACKLKFM